MLRPFVLDCVEALVPATGAAIAFWLGKRSHRWRVSWFWLLIVLAFVVLLGAWPSYWNFPTIAGPYLFPVGGELILAMWAVFFLFGVLWNSPKRTLSGTFLVILMVVFGTIVALKSGGRLIWRLGGGDMWTRSADPQSGAMLQSFGTSCGPASAVMLLHRYGIEATEGEMAYLANTAILGTDINSLVHAIAIKASPCGKSVRLERTDYDGARRLGKPFIAYVWVPNVGAHVILVLDPKENEVDIIDPLFGARTTIPRAQFESWWNRSMICIEES